ncbi:MAG: translation initiation factor IF-3 [Parvularculaceae bacterium]|nr:translation initiation factor IF-3 [Parvularculaceae bacterium]
MNAAPPKPTGPRMNDDIRAPRILVITDDGEKQGPMSPDQGRELAARAGLDLVEVSPNDDMPVCKLMDWGKHKYQQQKKKAEAKKKQKIVEIKEIKMRPNIDKHDYEVKTKAMRRFFDDGDKVKVTLRFRGREMAHQERGMELLNKVREDFEETTKVEAMPKLEGRQMMMVLAPR